MGIEFTTLCYLEKNDKYLMLHRVSKKHDINKDKWIGVGGHMEAGESPEDCVIREVREETGLTLRSQKFRGIVTFLYKDVTEYMALFTSDDFEDQPLAPCDEGTLEWVPKNDLTKLDLWAGDYIFLMMLADGRPFFSLKLRYDNDGILREAVLDGKPMELFDVLDDSGNVTGQIQERNVVHRLGIHHRTVHLWLWRESGGHIELLLQKRSATKDSNPGCYDISSAGHIDAGDEPLPSALRELSEELGVRAEESEMRFIGLCPNYSEKIFYGKPFRDNELSYVYLVDKKVDISQMTLQESEVESVMWMDIDEVIRRQADGTLKNCLHDRELQMVRTALIG